MSPRRKTVRALSCALLLAVVGACGGSGSTPPTDGGATDSATAIDGPMSIDAAPDSAIVGICNGCVRGPNATAGATDSVALTTVTGLVDGVSDTVTVTGTFHLESAATASLFMHCLGTSSNTKQTVAATPAGQMTSYTISTNFQQCAADTVQVGLTVENGSTSANYVKCCFLKGRDF